MYNYHFQEKNRKKMKKDIKNAQIHITGHFSRTRVSSMKPSFAQIFGEQKHLY